MSSLSDRIKIFSDGSVQLVSQEIIVPTHYPWFAFIEHWHTLYGRSYIAQRRIEEGNPYLHAGASGDPSVFACNLDTNDRAVHMTPALEQWLFDRNVESCGGNRTYDQVIQAVRNAIKGDKAFSNGTGFDDGYQSTILNENIGAEPWKLQLTCANGFTGKVVGPKQRKAGKWCYPFETMNAQDSATLDRTLANSWWTFMTATVSTIEPAPKGLVTPFPYHGDYDVVIPFIANGNRADWIGGVPVSWIEEKWVRFLPEDTNQPQFPYYDCWVSEAQWKEGRNIN